MPTGRLSQQLPVGAEVERLRVERRREVQRVLERLDRADEHPVDREEQHHRDDGHAGVERDPADPVLGSAPAAASHARRGRRRRHSCELPHAGLLLDEDEEHDGERGREQARGRDRRGVREVVEAEGLLVDVDRKRVGGRDRPAARRQVDQRELLDREDRREDREQAERRQDRGDRDVAEAPPGRGAVDARRLVEAPGHGLQGGQDHEAVEREALPDRDHDHAAERELLAVQPLRVVLHPRQPAREHVGDAEGRVEHPQEGDRRRHVRERPGRREHGAHHAAALERRVHEQRGAEADEQ